MAHLKILEGVDLKRLDKPLYFVTKNLKELEDVIREYEIVNTVAFVIQRSDVTLNKDVVPWAPEVSEHQLSRRVKWNSSTIPSKFYPFSNVAHRFYACRYGKHRHKNPEAKQRKIQSTKIGCPCSITMNEIIRYILPPMMLNKCRKTLCKYMTKELVQLRDGQPTTLQWCREFHCFISPLECHSHAIGEAAGPHQKVDNMILEKIQELAKSGITMVDVVNDYLKQWVETELFKGRELPHPENKRFYPDRHTIYNHVYRGVKISQIEDGHIPPPSTNPPACSATATEVPEFSEVQELECDDVDYVPHSLFQETRASQQTASRSQTDVNLDILIEAAVSSERSDGIFAAPTPGNRKRHKARPIAAITADGEEVTLHGTRLSLRTPKDRFQSLVETLNKITDYIEEDEHYSKLSTALINVIMMARKMMPPEKSEILFEKEYRQLKAPRRIRELKTKKVRPLRCRVPDLKEGESEKPPTKKSKHWSEIYDTKPIQAEGIVETPQPAFALFPKETKPQILKNIPKGPISILPKVAIPPLQQRATACNQTAVTSQAQTLSLSTIEAVPKAISLQPLQKPQPGVIIVVTKATDGKLVFQPRTTDTLKSNSTVQATSKVQKQKQSNPVTISSPAVQRATIIAPVAVPKEPTQESSQPVQS